VQQGKRGGQTHQQRS